MNTPTKIVIVTGGGRGIGKAISLALGEKGYYVCVNYKTNENAADEVVDLIERKGGKAIAIKADVSKENEVVSLFETVDQLKGDLNGLVNNAGVLGAQSTLVNMDVERLKNTFDTNVLGVMLCCREAVKRMSQNGGAIVNISSGAAKSGSPNEYIDYAASKGAIDTFTIGLAKELGQENIRVNAVRPGFVETEMHQIPDRLESVKSIIPMGRVARPLEIAKAVEWLLSEDASYASGALLDIAGGK